MASKINFKHLEKVSGGKNRKGKIKFKHFTIEQVAMLKVGDRVSVLRDSAVYQCTVFIVSSDGGNTIDVRGGGLPDDLVSASFNEVGPIGQDGIH